MFTNVFITFISICHTLGHTQTSFKCLPVGVSLDAKNKRMKKTMKDNRFNTDA